MLVSTDKWKIKCLSHSRRLVPLEMEVTEAAIRKDHHSPVKTQVSPMSTLPQTQMALVCHSVGKYALTRDARTPTPGTSTVIVRTVTVSVQPHDWKMAEFSPTPGAVAGCDFAGVVVQVGSSVRADFTEGDRVYGVVFGSNPLQPYRGAFCQYVEADPSLLAHIPPSMSFEEAATLPTGLGTVGMALYHCLGLPWPSRPLETPVFVLVYGASSATGWYAVQLVKLYVVEEPRRHPETSNNGAGLAPYRSLSVRRRTTT
jgi:D-arabinose 1-dehydrogenase-like Zn-dependent alcohol dehydrogenase